MDLIDSLVQYVKDVKPYHTKIYGVDVEYRAFESVTVEMTEKLNLQIFLGAPFRADLDDFSWQVSDLVTPAFDTPGEAVLSDYFDISRGWDSAPYDMFGWDNETLESSISFKKKSFLMDTLFVRFTENLEISIDQVTYNSNVDDCMASVHLMWDNVLDGAPILKTESNIIHIIGKFDEQFNNMSLFRIINSTINNGEYGILNVLYDNINDITIITTSSVLIDSARDGKVLVGNWDVGGWDGDNSYNVSTPISDMYTRTQFTEQLLVMDGYGWDDPRLGGWDNNTHTWDDGNVVFDHLSSDIEYDVDFPCEDNLPNVNPVRVNNGSVGNVVFSSEKGQPPVPYENLLHHNYNINWTEVSVPDGEYRAVEYSPELNIYVAVSSTIVGGSSIIKSNDGLDWQSVTHPIIDGGLRDIVWAPYLNLFCAVGYSTDVNGGILISSDGTTWTSVTIPTNTTDNQFCSVCWSPLINAFVVVSDAIMSGTYSDIGLRNHALRSGDGVNWDRSMLIGAWMANKPESNRFRPKKVIWTSAHNDFIVIGQKGEMLIHQTGNSPLSFSTSWQYIITGDINSTTDELVMLDQVTYINTVIRKKVIMRISSAPILSAYYTKGVLDVSNTQWIMIPPLPLSNITSSVEVASHNLLVVTNIDGQVIISDTRSVGVWTSTTGYQPAQGGYITDICWTPIQNQLVVTKLDGLNRIMVGKIVRL